ncbi:helix-turn-helix domain-containing protein [Aureispira anguillae]|uniref:Helix-turn-helix domain-containing protein n=1 Tax=Aureispira anguillae TaxID=2864201 RepID=A0A916DSA0_9BACT|nr:helix-turn-helix transcriptional regulator [Aureispira anguillae]BDS10676.1 helix-turn-helix domain-containing protein [Aureispira anguillae]BDS10685.1 helix-turn-helix domain-containing protein [Aureispira anguillae]
MLNIGDNISKLRKAKNWSQGELADKIGSSRIMIGKYERGDNLPSVEVLAKLAQIFEVSVDFLLGQGINASYDKRMVERLDDIEKLPPEEKNKIFNYIDLIIRDAKTRQAYS